MNTEHLLTNTAKRINWIRRDITLIASHLEHGQKQAKKHSADYHHLQELLDKLGHMEKDVDELQFSCLNREASEEETE